MRPKCVKMKRKERIIGCMLGGAAGDAFGYMASEPGSKPQITCATETALHIAESLISFDGQPVRSAVETAHKIIVHIKDIHGEWLETAHKNGYQPRCVFTTVAPVTLFDHEGLVDAIQIATFGGQIAKISHSLPDCFMSATLFSFIMYHLADETGTVSRQRLKTVINEGQKILPHFLDYDLEKTYSEIYPEQVAGMLKSIDTAVKLSETDITEDEALAGIGDGTTAGQILAIALYSCLKHHGKFAEAVSCATRISGDRCCAGAVTGNIAGLLNGRKSIPEEWTAGMDSLERILKVSENLSTLSFQIV